MMIRKMGLVLGMVLALTAAGKAEEGYLSLSRRNVVILPGNSNKAVIWISYVGKISNVCGFKIMGTSEFNLAGEALQKALKVANRDVTVPIRLDKDGVANVTVASVNGPQYYGSFITVKTKSGESFKEVVSQIISETTSAPEMVPTDLVLVANHCR